MGRELISRAIATALLVSGASVNANADETFEVAPFDKIYIEAGASVVIYPSDDFRVIVKTRLAEQFDVKVDSGTLILECDFQACRRARNVDAEFEIYASDLVMIEIARGGDAVLNSIYGDMENFDAKVRGGGNIDLTDVAVTSLNANVRGGGGIEARVSDNAHATVRGGGRIDLGDTAVNTLVAQITGGGGTVRRRN